MERRGSKISEYKTNQSLINKKKVKQESSYDYASLAAEIGKLFTIIKHHAKFYIEKLEVENKALEKTIICKSIFYLLFIFIAINKDLSDDLTDLSLSEKIEYDVKEFTDKYKNDLFSETSQMASHAPY